MDVRLPDGTIIRNVPDGTTREQLTVKLKANGYSFDEPKSEPAQSEQEGGLLGAAKTALRLATPAGAISALASPEGRRDLGNAVAGGVRGAGSIGATVLAPVDMATDAIKGDRGPTLSSLITGQKPLSRNQERRQAMTEALRDLGADTDSTAFKIGETGTEVAGTQAVGGVVAKGLAKLAPAAVNASPVFNRLLAAIQSGGMSTGGRVAANPLAQAADLGIRVAGGAINGGASAGLVNPEDASLGAKIGGAAPVVTKVAGAAGRAVGAAVNGRIARNAAVQKVAGEVGEEALPQAVADLQTYYPKGAENIPVSAAGVTQNPALARLEQGSRLREAPAWWEFDQRQGKAVFDNVMDATKEAGDLGARKAARQENWQQAWQTASENTKPRLWQKRMTQFGADMEKAMQSPESSNPAVRRVLEEVNAEMDRVGPNFSPAHLQQIRANLNGKVQPMSTDPFKSAPRDNPAIISLKQELDDILNVSTGGKWQKVLEGYAKDSDAVRASAAAGKVRGAFLDEQTGRVVGPTLNPDTPLITQAGLNRAMNAARQPDKTLALSGEANNKLEATLDALRRQGMVQGLKRTATAGGGSDTIPNALAAAAETKMPSMLLQAAGLVRKIGAGKTDAQMAKLLADPDALAAELERYMRPKSPNKLSLAASRAAPALAASPD